MGENAQSKIVITRKLPADFSPLSPSPSTPPTDSTPIVRMERLRVEHWYRFLVELRTSLHAGLPLLNCLALTIKTSDRAYLREIARKLHTSISKGAGLEASLNLADEIPAIIRHTFIAGARAGNLHQVLDFLIEHFRWLMEIRSRLLQIIIYPAALIILGVMVMIFRDILVRHLGPKNEAIADIWFPVTAGYLLPVLVGGITAMLLSFFIKGKKSKPFFDKLLLKIPYVGGTLKTYNLTLFFQMLSTALKSGLPVDPAFRMALQSCPNAYIRDAMMPAAAHLRNGCSFTESFAKTGILDKSLLGNIRSGELSGSLPAILDKVTTWHKKHLKTRITGLIAGFSPFFTLLVAGAYFGGPEYLAAATFLLVFGRRIV